MDISPKQAFGVVAGVFIIKKLDCISTLFWNKVAYQLFKKPLIWGGNMSA